MFLRSCFSKYNKGEKVQRDCTVLLVNIENIKREWKYYFWAVRFFWWKVRLIPGQKQVLLAVSTEQELIWTHTLKTEPLDYVHSFSAGLKGRMCKQELRTRPRFNGVIYVGSSTSAVSTAPWLSWHLAQILSKFPSQSICPGKQKACVDQIYYLHYLRKVLYTCR